MVNPRVARSAEVVWSELNQGVVSSDILPRFKVEDSPVGRDPGRVADPIEGRPALSFLGKLDGLLRFVDAF